MRTLTPAEVDFISGATTATTAMGYVGGIGGAYYGGSLGFAVGGTIAFFGLMLSFATASGSPIWPGVYFSLGALGVCTVGGAIIGSALGAGAGMAGGYVADKLVDKYSS